MECVINKFELEAIESLFEGRFAAVCPSKAAGNALCGCKVMRLGTVCIWLIVVAFSHPNTVPGTHI